MVENFTASRGWFKRFERRRNLHSVKMTGETASADVQAADEFSTNLQAITERRNYPTQLVFNGDETGLFWKRMPSRTFTASEEKSASGFKANKHRLTLLLGGNAEGDFTRELYKEKKMTRQLSLDSFFKRKQAEPAPDSEGDTDIPTTSPSPRASPTNPTDTT